MKGFLLPLLTAISGGVLYHFSSKSVPATFNPVLAIITAYLIAIVVCLLGLSVFPLRGSLTDAAREINWAICGIGVGAALIEIGFLLAYRSGSQLSLSSIIVNVAVALLLIPVSLAFFREKLSAWNVLGIVLCLAGLALISKKS